MKTTLSNGATIEGTPSQIAELFAARPDLRPSGPTYNSNTHGIISIKDMDTMHIRNALRKKYGQWLQETFSIVDTGELVATLVDGPGEDSDREFRNLLIELSKRTS